MDRQDLYDRRQELQRWLTEQSAEFANEPFPPEVRQLFSERRAELAGLEEQLAELQQRDNYLRSLASRPGNTERGAGAYHTVPNGGGEDRARPHLSTGLRAVERHSELLSKRGGTIVETMLRESDTLGLGARYLDAVGNPHYESAFAKILVSPQDAHYRFTPQETEAVQRVSRVEQERALVEGTGSAGGFAVPFTLDPTIIHTDSGAINPLRDLATIRQVSATNQWRGVSADAPTAAYQLEAAPVVDSSPVLTQPTIFVATGRAFVPVSFEIWQDWAGISTELANLLQQSRDKLDATKMLTGTGATGSGGEPGGLLNIGGTGGLTTAQRVQTAVAATFSIGDVYLLKAAVAATVFYSNANWMFHPGIGDKAYRFVGGGNATEPPLFADFDRSGPVLGKPYREISTMVQTTTTASRIAVLGDFSGYQIVDRLGTTIEIIPNLFGAAQGNLPTGQRGLLMWWRTGSGVIAANKLRYLEVL